jgi:tetratricopeptide (TPR) repeat protein
LFRDYSRLDDEAAAAPPPVNWLARGDSAYEREEFAQAVVYYRESARLGMQEPVAWFNAANAMVRLDRNPEAAEAYRRSLRAAPGFLKAHQNLAALHQLAGNFPDAAKHYEAAARLDSADANSRYRLGELAQQTGDAAEALRWFEQALRADPLHEGAASGTAQVLLAARDTAAALLWMERYTVRAVQTARPASWALLLHVDLAVASGRREEGIRLYHEAAAATPDDVRPWLRMARALRAAGRLLEAGIALRQGLEAAPARGELWAALGSLRFEGGDPLGAREAFARAYRLGSPEGLQGLEMLAAWHERRHEPAAASAVRDTLGFK